MNAALSRIGASVKHLLRFYIIFGAGFVAGCIFEAIALMSLVLGHGT